MTDPITRTVGPLVMVYRDGEFSLSVGSQTIYRGTHGDMMDLYRALAEIGDEYMLQAMLERERRRESR